MHCDFPPPQIYLRMGEENHKLCCVFIQILPNPQGLHPLQLKPNLITLAQLVVRLSRRHKIVCSNPCWCVTILAENIAVLSGRLVENQWLKRKIINTILFIAECMVPQFVWTDRVTSMNEIFLVKSYFWRKVSVYTILATTYFWCSTATIALWKRIEVY